MSRVSITSEHVKDLTIIMATSTMGTPTTSNTSYYRVVTAYQYLLPSHVQCKRFNAPSTFFQCCRWKNAYAMASLSPLLRMCSGGNMRLFISSKYWNIRSVLQNNFKHTCKLQHFYMATANRDWSSYSIILLN